MRFIKEAKVSELNAKFFGLLCVIYKYCVKTQTAKRQSKLKVMS